MLFGIALLDALLDAYKVYLQYAHYSKTTQALKQELIKFASFLFESLHCSKFRQYDNMRLIPMKSDLMSGIFQVSISHLHQQRVDRAQLTCSRQE